MLENGLVTNTERSVRLLRTLQSCIMTMAVKAMVCARSTGAFTNKRSVPSIMVVPMIRSPAMLFVPMMGVRCGFLRMMSCPAGSTLNASAGMPSVTRLIQRSWMARKGNGSASKSAVKTVITSPAFAASKYRTDFPMLS